MSAETATGAVLLAGLMCFLIGASAWRIAYEQPLIAALPVIHVDRRRRAFIHGWMTVAMFMTPAGLAALPFIPDLSRAAALFAMAFAVYALGAGCWIASLAFRLTVVPWAAERTVADGVPPEDFAALHAWADSLYAVHMATAYAAFVLIGAAIVVSGGLPAWVGYVGIGWGLTFVGGLVWTRFAGAFNPPFWAHMYTALVGLVLLTA